MVRLGSFFYDEHFEGFAGFVAGHADAGHFQHFVVVGDDFFDFVGVNVEAGYDDEVFFAVDQFEPAFFVHDGDVAGSKKPRASMVLAVSSGRFQ